VKFGVGDIFEHLLRNSIFGEYQVKILATLHEDLIT
jgi:hypothetical protein